MTTDSLKLAQNFVSILPHSVALAMEVVTAGDGKVTMRMPYNEGLVGDPQTGVLFGGAVSALMDTCAGISVLVHEDAKTTMATLGLRIDYMRAATPGQAILAKADCYHVTHNVAFVRAFAYDENTSDPVATAAGAFSLDRKAGVMA